jgi:hypothetical protein
MAKKTPPTKKKKKPTQNPYYTAWLKVYPQNQFHILAARTMKILLMRKDWDSILPLINIFQNIDNYENKLERSTLLSLKSSFDNTNNQYITLHEEEKNLLFNITKLNNSEVDSYKNHLKIKKKIQQYQNYVKQTLKRNSNYKWDIKTRRSFDVLFYLIRLKYFYEPKYLGKEYFERLLVPKLDDISKTFILKYYYYDSKINKYRMLSCKNKYDIQKKIQDIILPIIH